MRRWPRSTGCPPDPCSTDQSAAAGRQDSLKGEARQRQQAASGSHFQSLVPRLTEDLRYALRDLPLPTSAKLCVPMACVSSPALADDRARRKRPTAAALAGTESAVVGWQLQPEPVARFAEVASQR